MNDSNLGIHHPSRPCKNQNSANSPSVMAVYFRIEGNRLLARLQIFRLVYVGMGVQQKSRNVLQINAY